MAGKRLVMGPSPGTGLFSHDVKQRERARYARDPPEPEARGAVGVAKSAALQEEERVNGRLVEILERRCAKLRQRAEEQERLRAAAEDRATAAQAELGALQGRVASLEAAEHELAEQRGLAAQHGAALQGALREGREAQRALREGEQELRRGRAEAANSEEQWKAQVAQLLEEARAGQSRNAELEAELQRSRAEAAGLADKARELVRLYEEESAQRLELEERCIAMEERLRSLEQGNHGELDAARQKAKQSFLARQHMDAHAQQLDGKCKEAMRRAEQAEQRNVALEAEMSKLRSLCAERGRRLESEAKQRPPRAAEQHVSQCVAAENASTHAASRLQPAPACARVGNRPDTCGSSSSAANSSITTPANLNLREAKGCKMTAVGPELARSRGGEARLPPGAIRRAGSVPVRRQSNQACEPRSRSVRAPPQSSGLESRPLAAAGAAPASPASSRAWSGPADLDLEDRIPDDPEDSSDEG